TLVEYGLPRRPSTVVWLFYENDPGDLLSEQKSPLLHGYLESDQRQDLLGKQREIDAYWRDYLRDYQDPSLEHRANARLLLSQILALQNLRSRLGLRRVQQGDVSPELSAVLARAQQLSSAAGARMLLVYLPSYGRFHGTTDSDPRPQLLAIAARLQ